MLSATVNKAPAPYSNPSIFRRHWQGNLDQGGASGAAALSAKLRGAMVEGHGLKLTARSIWLHGSGAAVAGWPPLSPPARSTQAVSLSGCTTPALMAAAGRWRLLSGAALHQEVHKGKDNHILDPNCLDYGRSGKWIINGHYPWRDHWKIFSLPASFSLTLSFSQFFPSKLSFLIPISE